MPTTLIQNIHSIHGIIHGPSHLKKGSAMKDVGVITNAFILFDNTILAFGPMSESPGHADLVIDAMGGMILPAWCDSHTHIVFAGSRANEFVLRLQGKTYEEIALAGGGILHSAEKLNHAGFEVLYAAAKSRLDEVIQLGTGTIEIKSGYGLTFESEIKMLEVIQKLKQNTDAHVKSTFLGAHAIPTLYKNNRDQYIRIVTEQMLPHVAERQLADYCDVFCDEGFFTVEETDVILTRASSLGIKAKIHANELANSGGVQIGIKHRAVSVDHLERIGLEEIIALASCDTIPTALPNVSFFLDIPYAPCRQMIDNGLGIALASDYNPGSSPSGNIPLLMSIACHQMKLLPEEAFNAVTINGACALELQDITGSITVGKTAHLVLTKPYHSLAEIMYFFGTNPISKVWLRGNLQS